MRFKELGLIIIDEEQRFGVSHKEHLKQLRREVDVLTLTATPIPRTLHMSLSGIRDMTTMDTPPENRLPIKTHVATYEDRLVRDAILREIYRGGQVYFVHNRVQLHISCRAPPERVGAGGQLRGRTWPDGGGRPGTRDVGLRSRPL